MRDTRARTIPEKGTLAELEEVKAEEGRTPMNIASGYGLPRFTGRQLTRGVANKYICESNSYVADVVYGGVIEGMNQKFCTVRSTA